jgi:phospholipid transport system substrate-binding protein
MKMLYYAFFAVLLIVQTAMATVVTDSSPDELLKNKIDAAITILKQSDLSKEIKDRQVLEIVVPMFDFNLMAKLTLGKKHWPSLSKEKQAAFTNLFIKQIKSSFLEKLNLYTDETFVIKDSVKKKKKVFVQTDLISKGSIISIVYKFWNFNNKWKIYDMEIEGVSIVQTYRSQFNEVLNNGVIDDLLMELEKLTNSQLPISAS